MEYYFVPNPNKKVINRGVPRAWSTLGNTPQTSFFGFWSWLTGSPDPAHTEFTKHCDKPVKVQPDLIDPAGLLVLLFLLSVVIVLLVRFYRMAHWAGAGLPGLISNSDQGDDSLTTSSFFDPMSTTTVATQTTDLSTVVNTESVLPYDFSSESSSVHSTSPWSSPLVFDNDCWGSYFGLPAPTIFSSSPIFLWGALATAGVATGMLTFYWWSRPSAQEIAASVDPSFTRRRRRVRIFFLRLAHDVVAPLCLIGFTVVVGGVVTYMVAVGYNVLPGPIGLYQSFERMYYSFQQFLTYGRVALSIVDSAQQGVTHSSQYFNNSPSLFNFVFRSSSDLAFPFSDSMDYLVTLVVITRKKTFWSALVNVLAFIGMTYLLFDHFYFARLPEPQHLHSFGFSYDAVKAYTEIVRYDQWLYDEMVRTKPCANRLLQLELEYALLDNLNLSKRILKGLSIQHNVLSYAVTSLDLAKEHVPQLVRPHSSYLERAAEQAIRLWRCVW